MVNFIRTTLWAIYPKPCVNVIFTNYNQFLMYVFIAGAGSEGDQISAPTVPIAQGDPSPPLRSTRSPGKHRCLNWGKCG